MKIFVFLLVIFSLVSLVAAQWPAARCTTDALNVRSSPWGDVLKTLPAGTRVTVYGKSADNQWAKISNDASNPQWAYAQYLAVCDPSPSGGRKVLDVPMVHQKWDTPDSFNGGWACGPTSTVMALAHLGRLAKHPITVSSPTQHTSDYGFYVSSQYTNAQGFTFNRQQQDASGHNAAGVYGWGTDNGLAYAWRLQDVLTKHGLANDFSYVTNQAADFARWRASIDAGKPVVVSTQILGYGHLMTLVGYDGDNLIVNDPFGDARAPGWGTQRNGRQVTYSWNFMAPKWYITIK